MKRPIPIIFCITLYIISFIVMISGSVCWAAPWPVSGSSVFLNPQKNYFLYPYNIGLDLENTPYSISLSINDAEKWVILHESTPHLITLRLKKFRHDREYEKSLKGWIKEYQKSGFQLLNQRMGEKRPERGWLHLQDAKGQQILQYFRYQNKIWVYFNCIGPKANLPTLQKSCEDLSSRVIFKTL